MRLEGVESLVQGVDRLVVGEEVSVLAMWVERVSRLVIVWHPGYGVATASEKGLRTAAVVDGQRWTPEFWKSAGVMVLWEVPLSSGRVGLGLFIVGQANLVEPHIAIEHAYLNPRGVKPRRQLRLRGYDNSVG